MFQTSLFTVVTGAYVYGVHDISLLDSDCVVYFQVSFTV